MNSNLADDLNAPMWSEVVLLHRVAADEDIFILCWCTSAACALPGVCSVCLRRPLVPGSSSVPRTLTAGIVSDTKRWPRSWRAFTWRSSAMPWVPLPLTVTTVTSASELWPWCCFSSPRQDLLLWTADKSEVEVVDLILKLREKLVSVERRMLFPH